MVTGTALRAIVVASWPPDAGSVADDQSEKRKSVEPSTADAPLSSRA